MIVDSTLPEGKFFKQAFDSKIFFVFFRMATKDSRQWRCGFLQVNFPLTTCVDLIMIIGSKMTQQTTCTDPRLGFAREVRGDHLPSSTKELGASSTTEDVLGTIDLNGKVAIVTGANCGIGFETSKALALHGAKVILACRDQEKANNAIQLIKTVEVRHYRLYCFLLSIIFYFFQPEAKLDFIHCDLTSLKSVKHFCDTFHSMNL